MHLKALRNVTNNPVYVTGGRQEYQIRPDGIYWYIKRYPRGILRPSLRGHFTSFRECEQQLITFLKSTDKWGKAMYPGKEPNGPRPD